MDDRLRVGGRVRAGAGWPTFGGIGRKWPAAAMNKDRLFCRSIDVRRRPTRRGGFVRVSPWWQTKKRMDSGGQSLANESPLHRIFVDVSIIMEVN